MGDIKYTYILYLLRKISQGHMWTATEVMVRNYIVGLWRFFAKDILRAMFVKQCVEYLCVGYYCQ